MTGLLTTLRAHAEADPCGIALDPIIAAPVTWKELAERVAKSAEELRRHLVPAHPYVMRLDHGTETAILELALLEAGIPVLSLPAFFTDEQVRHAVSACGAEDETLSGPQPAPSLLPRLTARVTFTSGSTGTPKGVCLSAGHMLTVAASVVDALGSAHAGRHCALLPPGILLETIAGFFATMLAGGTYVCPPQREAGLGDPFRPDFAAMVAHLADWRITSLILVPEYLAGLVAVLERSGQRLPDLTLVAVGGARVPVELLQRARALGLPVRQGYGLTECGSVVSLEGAGESVDGSVGRPLGHMRAAIASDGEIVLEGDMFLGTIGEPRAPGPLATGDIGRIDDQGRIWVEGRKSAMIVTSYGRNIAPEWVEAALMMQPEIAQALIHGDGAPAPEALLVPASADADLAEAVAAANRRLPAYAHVAAWREAAPFTPANGMLTGNGRLRRKAIARTWLEGEPSFFDELEAATWRDRLRFLTIPQVRAGLAGTISRRTYLDYLTQAYHHVRHTVPLMQAARARLLDRPALVTALDEYIEEETGHEEWILADIAAAGGDADKARSCSPSAATQAMVEHAYARIREGNAACFFGMVYVLESVSVALAQRGASAVAANLGLPPEAFTYLTSHGALDQDHMTFFAALVNGLDAPNDREAITAMAREMFALFGAMFAAIAMENQHVAA
ncbi:AMP-binding protein [Novosphingobium pentaromativorans]|uniref:AMP-dependent synthetase and ligase n=1 Tax=Novosphingobium pentaromativorans US6-1 TaxID=1088721 RepID=G6EGW9_9SPHN|nr:AMP-binding protein [Novosphingobium pentaromativorans]AIT82040.1 AMP-dependent synthetase [Novosphingobium pentaromativorans US6-1]EHJ59258.1 AMP-dependent synthetase and ligase [Novosphingobium pentaromativorans US6-1]